MTRVRRVDTHLGDVNWVGKLVIVYPGEKKFKTIPFFENPTISESQNPRYANFAVVGRSSNLFGYLGSDSRKFNISFNMTLPHIVDAPQKDFESLHTGPPTKIQKRREMLEANTQTLKNFNAVNTLAAKADMAFTKKAMQTSLRRSEEIEANKKEAETWVESGSGTGFTRPKGKEQWSPWKKSGRGFTRSKREDLFTSNDGQGGLDLLKGRFKMALGSIKRQEGYKDQIKKNNAQIRRMKHEDRFLAQKQKNWTTDGVARHFDDEYRNVALLSEERALAKSLSYSSPLLNPDSEGSKLRRKAINAVASMVALLRSTVINNTEDVTLGPPIVRLNFGILYQDVPCVCKGYTIQIDEKAGFDVKTLLPRKFNIRLSLEEARDFSSGNSPEPIKDGLVGWEVLLGSVVMPGATLDPGMYDIKEAYNSELERGTSGGLSTGAYGTIGDVV